MHYILLIKNTSGDKYNISSAKSDNKSFATKYNSQTVWSKLANHADQVVEDIKEQFSDRIVVEDEVEYLNVPLKTLKDSIKRTLGSNRMELRQQYRVPEQDFRNTKKKQQIKVEDYY